MPGMLAKRAKVEKAASRTLSAAATLSAAMSTWIWSRSACAAGETVNLGIGLAAAGLGPLTKLPHRCLTRDALAPVKLADADEELLFEFIR